MGQGGMAASGKSKNRYWILGNCAVVYPKQLLMTADIIHSLTNYESCCIIVSNIVASNCWMLFLLSFTRKMPPRSQIVILFVQLHLTHACILSILQNKSPGILSPVRHINLFLLNITQSQSQHPALSHTHTVRLLYEHSEIDLPIPRTDGIEKILHINNHDIIYTLQLTTIGNNVRATIGNLSIYWKFLFANSCCGIKCFDS